MEFKILQVNAWTGRIKYGLINLIKKGDYDVVCLQEAIWDKNHTKTLETFIDTVDKIKEETGFEYDFRSPIYGFKMLGDEVEFTQGNVILSKIPIKETEAKTLCGEYCVAERASNFEDIFENHAVIAQKAVLENGLAVFNYHGYWQKDPLGSVDTVKYMKIVADMIKNSHSPAILCGDLNIIAESPAMRELDFMQDLTATKGVKSTLHPVKVKENVACDHILITDDISCKNFQVIEDFVSDHKALEATLDVV